MLSAVSVLVVAQSSSEIPEGLMNNPVFLPVSPDNMKTKVALPTDRDFHLKHKTHELILIEQPTRCTCFSNYAFL